MGARAKIHSQKWGTVSGFPGVENVPTSLLQVLQEGRRSVLNVDVRTQRHYGWRQTRKFLIPGTTISLVGSDHVRMKDCYQ